MENKEPDDDLFDRLNVSQNISVILPLYLEMFSP